MKYVFEDIFSIETTIVELLIVDQFKSTLDFRIKMMEMLFENMRILSVLFVNSAVASMFLSGRTTGCSVELGHQNANVF